MRLNLFNIKTSLQESLFDILLNSLSIDGSQGQGETGDDRPATPPVQPWSPPSAPPNHHKETPDVDWLQDYRPAQRNHWHEDDWQMNDWQINIQENEVRANAKGRHHRREYFHWIWIETCVVIIISVNVELHLLLRWVILGRNYKNVKNIVKEKCRRSLIL